VCKICVNNVYTVPYARYVWQVQLVLLCASVLYIYIYTYLHCSLYICIVPYLCIVPYVWLVLLCVSVLYIYIYIYIYIFTLFHIHVLFPTCGRCNWCSCALPFFSSLIGSKSFSRSFTLTPTRTPGKKKCQARSH